MIVYSEREIGRKTEKGREKIISLLVENGTLSTTSLAAIIGITPKDVEKHLANLNADGILHRIGPDKGDHWEVIKMQ